MKDREPILGNSPDQSVLDALNNADYRWRTVAGIAEEIGVDEVTTSEILTRHRQDWAVVQHPLLSKDGKELFTTRAHFLATASWQEKLLGALKLRLF